MAAPEDIKWGNTVGSYGRIGIYIDKSNSNTTTSVDVQVWFWSKYSVSDTSNTLYFDNLASSGSATTSKGSVSIRTTVDSGSGWSTSNQKKIATYSYSYTRGTSEVTRYCYAKLANIDRVGGTMSVGKTFHIPKLATYTISYNANGGSGAPSSQTKYYGKSIKLSTTKPTRTGYTFRGWGTSTTDTSVDYAAGATYSANASDTLYAIWKANTYKVSYNANGGSGAPSSQTKTYGTTLTLSSTKPTRAKYTFKGWGTSASATTVAYTAGGKYTSNAAITLYAIWELAYIPPTISNLKAYRSTSSGTATELGTYAKVTCNWSCDQTIGTNKVKKITIKWEVVGGTTSTTSTVTPSTLTTSGTVSSIIGSNRLSTESSYIVTVTVTDSTGESTPKKVTIPTTKFLLDFKSGGNGVAVGKTCELDDTFDVGFYSRFRKNITVVGGASTDGIGGIYGTDPSDSSEVLAFQPQNSSHNTVVGYGNYERGKGNTYIYGNDVLIYSKDAGSVGFKPYYSAGDTVQGMWVGAGFITGASKNVLFTIFFSKPAIGNPTVTVTSVDGILVRQDGKYLYGASSGVYIKPSSYNYALDFGGNAVRVTAVMSNTKNATNNSPCGIAADIKITFS